MYEEDNKWVGRAGVVRWGRGKQEALEGRLLHTLPIEVETLFIPTVFYMANYY